MDEASKALLGVQKELTEIKIILARQEEHLKEHMRRSVANEEAVKVIEVSFARHMGKLDTVMKIAAAVGVAVMTGVVKYLLVS